MRGTKWFGIPCQSALLVSLCAVGFGCSPNEPRPQRVVQVQALNETALAERLFADDVSDSLWIARTYDLFWNSLMDTLNRPVTVVGSASHWSMQSVESNDCHAAPCYLSYAITNWGMRLSYVYGKGNAVHAYWCDDVLIYTSESCFNDAWGRCGMGFQRESVYRNDRIIAQRFDYGSKSRAEVESHPCNCLNEWDRDFMMAMRRRCIEHYDAH